MNFKIVYDFQQYDSAARPLEEELLSRKHTRGERGASDIHVALQHPIGFNNASGHVFWIMHGVSCTKAWDVPKELLDKSIGLTRNFISPAPYWTKELLSKDMGDVNIIETGWPKADFLYSLNMKREQLREEVRKKLKMDDRPIVAYFPTYVGGGHGARDVADPSVIHNALEDKYNVVFCGHQMESRKTKKLFKGCPSSLWESGDFKMHVLIAADAIITDTSSIAYEACVVNSRPVILLDSAKDPYYFNLKHEKTGKILDLGLRTYIENIRESVEQAIAESDEYLARRLYWRNLVLGPVDGKSSKRIADYMEQLINKQTGDTKSV